MKIRKRGVEIEDEAIEKEVLSHLKCYISRNLNHQYENAHIGQLHPTITV